MITSPLHTRKEAVEKLQLPLSSGFYTQPVQRAASKRARIIGE